MFKETIKRSIKNISSKLSAIALEVNAGKIKDSFPISNVTFGTSTLSRPKKDWAKIVDGIESPFVDEYDEAEYKKNAALSLMGLYEMKMMLRAFGLLSLKQTEYSDRPLSGKKFLVSGCGTGREVINLAALGGSVIGIDATKGYVDLTAKKLTEVGSVLGPNPDIKLFQCPAENYPYKSNSLDGITSLFGVINHIQDWKEQIWNYAIALKGNGKLVIEKYGSNDALVFKLRKKGEMEYDPSILQRRDPKGQGILLGDSEEVLPSNFPNDWQFRYQLEANGFEIQKRIGLLRIAALFPKEPTSDNLVSFLKLVSRIDQEAYNFLYQFQTAEDLLLASFMYDLQSQRRKNNPVKIKDFAYVFYDARRMKQEEFFIKFSR